MLNCKTVATEASNYLNGDLPWLQRLSIKLHIAICGQCRCYLKQLHSTIKTITIIKPQEPDDKTDLVQLAETLKRAYNDTRPIT